MTECAYDKTSGTLVFSFAERMDTLATENSARIISDKLSEISSEQPLKEKIKIVFDLSKTKYVASAFLRLCLSTAKQAEGGNFTIRETSPEIMKVFKIAGMDTFLRLN